MTKTTVLSNYYNVLKLNFNISDLVLLFIKTTIDLLKPSIHLLFHLYKSSIHFFKLFVYFTKLRNNKFTLIKKFLSHSLIVSVKCLTKNHKTLINIFKRWFIFRRWNSYDFLSQLVQNKWRIFEFELYIVILSVHVC